MSLALTSHLMTLLPRRSIVRAAAALLAAGCTATPEDPEPGPEAVEIAATCAPTYGAYAEQFGVPFAVRDGDTLRLDLARPATAGPHPVVLLLHGGGWVSGDRSSMHGEMRLLASQGYAAAAVQYRLTQAPTNVFPAAVHDVRCATRFLRTRAGELALDPARVGVVGYSAGAHLASMLGVGASGGPEEDGCLADAGADAAVQGVVALAGPQDLRVNGPYTDEQAQLVTNFLGVFPGDAPAVAEAASPIAHVSGHSAPFLLVHGDQDGLVPVEHARRMRSALHAADVPATLLELAGVGHGLPGLDATGSRTVGCTGLAFLDRWVRGR